MTSPTRDYHSERLPSDPRLRRDTDTPHLTDADRMKIAKAWARAVNLGAVKVIQIEMRRDAKRGFEIP